MHQVVPRGLASDRWVLSSPVIQELTSPQDLLQDPPENPTLDVSQAQDGSPGVSIQISLLKVLRRKPVKDTLLASQELQEPQVCLRPPIYDCTGTLSEDILASLGAFPEEAQATFSN